jgi:threonine dehydrogenase-like Zn-dependent dehydrogenase
MPNLTLDTAAMKAAANDAYNAKVTAKLQEKYEVIAKRTSQRNAYKNALMKALGEADAAFDTKVADFEKAVAAATTGAEVSVALEAFNFHSRTVHFIPPVFTPSQED